VSNKDSRGNGSSSALLAKKKSVPSLGANKSSAGASLITSYFNAAAGSSSQTSAKRSLMRDSSPPSKRSSEISGVHPMRPKNVKISAPATIVRLLIHFFPQAMQEFLKNWGTFTADMVAKKEARDAADALKARQKAAALKAELKAKEALAKKPRKAAVKRKPLPSVNILKEIKQPWINKKLVARVGELITLKEIFPMKTFRRWRNISKMRLPR
jgi:hypothetical protein